MRGSGGTADMGATVRMASGCSPRFREPPRLFHSARNADGEVGSTDRGECTSTALHMGGGLLCVFCESRATGSGGRVTVPVVLRVGFGVVPGSDRGPSTQPEPVPQFADLGLVVTRDRHRNGGRQAA